jgi:hypothetical protein
MQLRDLLLSTRTIDATVLAQAEAHAIQNQLQLVHVLVSFKVVDGRRLARLMSRSLHFELIDVVAVDIHEKLLEVVPRYAAETLRVLPIGVKQAVTGTKLYLAMADPTNEATVNAVETATGLQVEPLVCDDERLQVAFDKHYGPLVADAPVLVGDLVGPGAAAEFLTESTAEALRFVQTVRSADVVALSDGAGGAGGTDGPTIEISIQRRPASLALGPDLTVDTRFSRPTSMALGDVVADQTSADAPRPTKPPAPTVVVNSPLDESTIVPDEDVVAPPAKTPWVPPSSPSKVSKPSPPSPSPSPSPPAVSTSKAAPKPTAKSKGPSVVVALSRMAPLLRTELRELLGAVEVVGDDVEACHLAVSHTALVLIEPRARSALLRALLDLEELDPRPRIVMLGGDPALHLLAFVDHHADAPADDRAIAIAVVAALRQAGVRV